ncbi:sulfotransferase domain-containing protein [cf. Phormidesmis sp. LEGE 11477]|uniref:sulfotransferase domain-containing protein n=1 Tax=cf. Phormidesmis sp. LEGE 11477 TaxID=1828680 RepID=UPI00187E623E|nr:sulfotransferase domain-containing protein [cf. Phormidesmis sp. LEGE 11477]MBE9063153.1 sulfotransferase [cf. Phormidesmis sp. LEGE 11477]
MVQPNFLIIGAAKAGTSSLYHYLNEHPQIYMSPVKEPRFFAPELYTDYLKDPYRSGAKEHRSTPMSLEEYLALFEDVSNETAIGEASTEYLYVPKTPERIKERLPDVRLIAVLRDPAERAYSAFCYQVRDGCEQLTFEEALAQEEHRRLEKKRWPGWHYERVGFYHEQVKRYFDLFDKKQIKIYLYKDLQADSGAVVKDACRFLNVEDTFTPDLTRRNVSAIPKNMALQNLLIKDNPLKTLVKPFIPIGLRKSIRSQNLKKKPALSPEIRQKLVADYREDILKLQDLIQKDLSHWLD